MHISGPKHRNIPIPNVYPLLRALRQIAASIRMKQPQQTRRCVS